MFSAKTFIILPLAGAIHFFTAEVNARSRNVYRNVDRDEEAKTKIMQVPSCGFASIALFANLITFKSNSADFVIAENNYEKHQFVC